MAKTSRLKLNIKLAVCVLAVANLVQVGAAATVVTKIEFHQPAGDKQASIVLNDLFLINEVKIKGNIGSGNISLIYPDYVNKQGRSQPQVEIVDESLAKTIRQAIVSDVPSAQKPVDFSYKITKISLLRQKDKALKAFTTVVFNNAVKVEARVMESKTGLWVAWPGRKSREGKWIDQFAILKYDTRQSVEKAIIDKYQVVRSEEP